MSEHVQNITRLMAAKGIESANQLAELSGVTQPTITRILNGTTPAPTDQTLKKLAAALGTTLADIKFSDARSRARPASQPMKLDRDSLRGAFDTVRHLAKGMRLDFGEGSEDGAIADVYEHLAEGKPQEEAVPVVFAYIERNRGEYRVRSDPDGASDINAGGKSRKSRRPKGK